MTILMTARWQCHPGSEQTIVQALREFVAAVGANEPRTRLYTAMQAADDSTRFLTYFIFENAEARAFHSNTPWVKRFTDTIYPLSVAPVEFTEYRLLASTLPDLSVQVSPEI